MRVMVTGGAGFIGSAVCRGFIARGYSVLAFDKLTYAATSTTLESLDGKSEFRLTVGDVANRGAVDAAINTFNPDWILHLAAETHVDRSIDAPADFLTTNVVGSYTILESALSYWRCLSAARRDVFRVLFVSTDEVYGSLGPTGAFTENTAYDPRSPYSATKAASDHLAMAWNRTYGLPILLSNCSNNYGPFQFPEKLIPLTLINVLAGRLIEIYGDGLNVRDWLHVDDHVTALHCILEGGRVGERYNVGARNERSNLEVVAGICEALKVEEKLPREQSLETLITFVADRAGHDRRYAVDPSKLEEELGWYPAIDFNDGLRGTVRWYIERRDWWESIGHHGARLGLVRYV